MFFIRIRVRFIANRNLKSNDFELTNKTKKKKKIAE